MIHGHTEGMQSVSEALPAALDHGVLLPVEPKRQFLDISADAIERADPICYSNRLDHSDQGVGAELSTTRAGRALASRPALALLALVLALLIAMPAQAQRPQVPVSADEVVRGDPARPWVSLVFNAGAGHPPALAMLDTLREREIHTTFFLMGWWAERNPEIVLRIAADGHEIASHGHAVFDLTSVSDAAVIADLEQADAVISAITGETTRPLWSPSAGYRDQRVRRIAASIGYRPIYWTVDSGDWPPDANPSRVRERVLTGAVNGAIIVMHLDSARSADSVAAILPDVIDGLRAAGLQLVTVSELITGELIPRAT